MADVSYISEITLPSGNTYKLKDAEARELLVGGVHFKGQTTTALVDGSTTNPIVIDGNDYTAVQGDLVIYKSGVSSPDQEFIFNGTKWNEFGVGLGAFKALAFKDSASGTYKKATSGSVSVPSTYQFTGTEGNVSVTSGTFTRITAVTPTTKYAKATASGTAVGANGTATVATAIGVTAQPTVTLTGGSTTSTGAVSYVASASAAASKMVTDTVNKVSAGTAKDVAKAGTAVVYGKANVGTAVTVATGLTGTKTFATSGIIASVSGETLTFAAAGTGTVGASTASITPATAAPSTQTIVPAVSNGQITPVSIGASVTVATGALDANGAGASVVTGVTPTTKYLTAAASGTTVGITDTATALTGVKVTAQPTITLALEDATATGRIGVVTEVAKESTSAAVTSTGTFTPAGSVTTKTSTSATVTITNSDATVTVS